MVDQISCVASSNAKPARMGTYRMSSLDVMKCFAAFCVVCIHYGSGWLSPITRCAVPIFFIITGYYYPMMVEKGKFWRHIRKLVIMALCASAFYGAIALTQQIRHDTLGEWVSNTFRLRRIVGLIALNHDMFEGHLWYFYAVLYDLIIFYFADKWRLTRWLQYATPILLLVFFMSSFEPFNSQYYFRNFLFFGLPCMMIGRMIKEKKDTTFSFLAKEQRLWIYPCVSLLLIGVEIYVHYFQHSHISQEMYIFTLPLLLPFFYAALRNPTFGEGTILATIGRKYSAYIYIFHVFAGIILFHFVKRDVLIYPFLVFGLSLCMAWLFVKILHLIKS